MPTTKNQKFRNKIKSRKSLSRLMVIQIFYQHNFFNDKLDLEKITKDLIENYALEESEITSSYRDKIDENLLNNLVLGLSMNLAKIDKDIVGLLRDGQKIDMIESLMLQILRLATFEIKFLLDVPIKVVIDEYVGIAASFFDSTKVTFVNAIIDAIAKKNNRI